MKIPALPILLLAVLLAVWPAPHSSAQEASFDLFYTNLADDGDWYNTPDLGYVWHPAIADSSEKWRPYTDGYWAQTDDGWAWVSYESFGWATYHYGRWARLHDIGWVWVPGYQWGPGWVSWRTSDEYVGWAPLPPRDVPASAATSVDYNTVEAVDDGYTAAVDQDYDIGPDNYCFVDVRQFGAPVLSEVILPPPRNLILIGSTLNVTNIYYRRGPERTIVYNNGPDFAFINAHVERPIQRLRIDRREDLAYLHESGRTGNPTVVKNGVLLVAAPVIARQAVNFAQMKPARIKQTIAQPQMVHGWSNAGGDAAQVQQLRERVKMQAQSAPRQARAEMPSPGVAPAAPEAELRERAPGNPPAPMPAVEARESRRDATERVDEKVTREEAHATPPAAAVKPPAPVADQPAASKLKTETLQERVARKRAQAQEQSPAPAAAPKPQAPPVAEEAHPARTPARQTPPPAREERQTTPPVHEERQAPPRPNQPAPQSDAAEREAYRVNRQQQLQAQQASQGVHRPDRPAASAAPEKGPAQPSNGDDKKKQPNN